MHYLLLLAVMCLTFTGCEPHYADCFPYHDNGRPKPVVAVLPMTDCSNAGLCWDVGEELTKGIKDNLVDRGELFLVSDQTIAKWQPKGCNYFGADLNFAKGCGRAQYVVALELIEHEVIPYKRDEITPLYPCHQRSCNSVLLMKVRVRVIDVRCEKPVVVLQEIFPSNHMIPVDRENVDYRECCWGTEAYDRSAFGGAHARLVRDIAQRIECAIGLW